eukprot:g2411.t1
MDGQKFWKAAAGGNRKAVFHTELAATEESGGAYCVGVGLSRVAETLLAAIEQLEDADLKRLLAAAPLRKAKEEAAALKPRLQVLNAGLAAAESGGSFSALKKKQKTGWAAGEEVDRSEEKATEAARALHAWLSLEKTPLRHLLIILGGRGAFFAGHMAEKTARTWVRHKPASAEDAIAAAVARAKKGSEKAAAPVGGAQGVRITVLWFQVRELAPGLSRLQMVEGRLAVKVAKDGFAGACRLLLVLLPTLDLGRGMGWTWTPWSFCLLIKTMV